MPYGTETGVILGVFYYTSLKHHWWFYCWSGYLWECLPLSSLSTSVKKKERVICGN